MKMHLLQVACFGLLALIMVTLQLRNPGEWLYALGTAVGVVGFVLAGLRMRQDMKGGTRGHGETPNR